MSELLGALLTLLLFFLAGICAELFKIWAIAYKRRGYVTKRQLRKIEKWLEEAYQTMLDFSLENKFDCYNAEEQKQLEQVLETLMDFCDMWEKGQIILVSEEREMSK